MATVPTITFSMMAFAESVVLLVKKKGMANVFLLSVRKAMKLDLKVIVSLFVLLTKSTQRMMQNVFVLKITIPSMESVPNVSWEQSTMR